MSELIFIQTEHIRFRTAARTLRRLHARSLLHLTHLGTLKSCLQQKFRREPLLYDRAALTATGSGRCINNRTPVLHPLSSNLNLRPVCDQSSDLFSCDHLHRAFEASLRRFSLVQGTYPPPARTHGHMTCKGMGFLCGFLCKQSNTTGSGLYILLITELTLLFYCSGMHCQIQTECLNAKKYSCVTLKCMINNSKSHNVSTYTYITIHTDNNE